MANSISGAHGAIAVGTKAVTTAGTRVALSTGGLYRSLTIVAYDNNTGRIYVGGADVASTTHRGLAAADSVTFTTDKGIDLSDVYLDASVSGESVDFYAST